MILLFITRVIKVAISRRASSIRWAGDSAWASRNTESTKYLPQSRSRRIIRNKRILTSRNSTWLWSTCRTRTRKLLQSFPIYRVSVEINSPTCTYIMRELLNEISYIFSRNFWNWYKYIFCANKFSAMSLEALGVSPEILTWAIISLAFIMLLLIVFIIVGIQAFALGGAMGSIINSLIPMGKKQHNYCCYNINRDEMESCKMINEILKEGKMVTYYKIYIYYF